MGMLKQCVDWLESGEKTPADLVALCRARIAEREPELRAWVQVAPQDPLGHGALDGIPFGVKDIFETRGLATEFGCPVYAGRRGQADSALVMRLTRSNIPDEIKSLDGLTDRHATRPVYHEC